LKVNGEVLIGDRALKAYLEDPKAYIDLAKTWNERTGLPFVFARVCITKNSNFYKKLTKNFLKQRVKIPRYILNRYANERQISQNEILNYLKVISYSIGPKEKIALKRFLNLAKSNSCQL
ncbi:MAG: MqnA/MqnD/SBP family protein, partial [Campylobacterales bacterium]|nr:MqnA/MqnD/SBP family protein [Campylobacterales bacterium]